MDKQAKLELEIAKEKNPTKERKEVHELARKQLEWETAMQKIQPNMQAARELLDKI